MGSLPPFPPPDQYNPGYRWLGKVYRETLEFFRQRCDREGFFAISGQEIADRFKITREQGERRRSKLVEAGLIKPTHRCYNRIRIYRISYHTTPLTMPEVSLNSSDPDCNIESVEIGADAPPLPPHLTDENRQDLVNGFRKWLLDSSGQTITRKQVFVICRRLKQVGLTLWEFWKGLIREKHPLERARDLGKVLWKIACNRLERPFWKEKPAQDEPKAQESAEPRIQAVQSIVRKAGAFFRRPTREERAAKKAEEARRKRAESDAEFMRELYGIQTNPG